MASVTIPTPRGAAKSANRESAYLSRYFAFRAVERKGSFFFDHGIILRARGKTSPDFHFNSRLKLTQNFMPPCQ
jgi:hypothetical protein